MTAKFVSPSRIARFYFQECDRYLRYSSTPLEERQAEGIPKTPYDHRPITQAILESGYAWEEQVLDNYLAGAVRVSPRGPETPIRERAFSVEETRDLVASIGPGEWIYQSTISPPQAFQDRYGLDPQIVQLTDCRPDLIQCLEANDGSLLLRVVDVKASPGLKLSHRIQATMYSMILEHSLESWGITDRTVDGMSGIWLAQAEEPETFDIRAMRPPLEAFLEHELQGLMERPAEDAFWHLYYRCEWCDYFSHCRDQMQRSDDVSRIPYLSTHAKRFLADLDPPVRTVKELSGIATDAKRSFVLNDCASLRGKQRRLALQTSALRKDQPLPVGGSSIAMPRAEHVRVLFTLQSEPVSGQLYAYAVYAQGVKDIYGEKLDPMTDVATDASAARCDELERNLVTDLYSLLQAVDSYNAEREDDWKLQKTLQVYCYDSYEWRLLTDVLLRRLTDPEVADAAVAVFLYFQKPELLQAEEHPASEVFFPVVVLIQALRQLFALPVEVTYRFVEVVNLLRPSQFAFDYRPDEYLTFELSNQLRSDGVFAMWTKGEDWSKRIARELKARLWAANSLINGIREVLDGQGDPLFAWPPKFRLPDAYPYRHVTLSRLAFLARYESVLDYLSVRTERMEPLEEQLRSGAALRVTHEEDDRFSLDPMHRDLDLDTGTFPSWILVRDDAEGREARLKYADYANKSRVWVPKNVPLALAAMTEVEGTIETPNQAVYLQLNRSSSMHEPEVGGTFLLGPRMTDFLSDHAISELQLIDAEDDPPFVRLLERPEEYLADVSSPRGVVAAAVRLAEEHGMTPSQLGAFRAITRRNLELVWGPAGTGKTHFLGLGILCLAAAYRRAGQSFRVLVTAFTHTAIDNCLRKLVELNEEHDILPELAVRKLKAGGDDTVEVMSEKGWEWPEEGLAVIGGTVWSIRKGGDLPADMVVIDEGSQLEVPPAAIAIRRVAEGGRLLIAGDDRQLPPIMQGQYPDPAVGEPLLHRSIFECLRQRDLESGAFTATLLENFRMNRTLCRYPAEQIYVAEYDSATREIAARTLRLLGGQGKGLPAELIDPQFPLVVAVLEGVRATAENVVEAGLVAEVATALRTSLLDGDGHGYPTSSAGDAAFWRHGLFIVSPHHAQINAVRKALADRRKWRVPPFVDTVDKMQGQECDAVIATYGVSDVEYAMNEKEFIYSLNRLNVAITRARAKTIVFLPRPLLEPPIAAFEDDRIAEGIAFMQGLVQFAERHGETDQWELGDGAELSVSRVR